MIDSMTCGGVEKSLLSFLTFLSDCQVDLLMTNKEGALLPFVPAFSNPRGVQFRAGRYAEWQGGRRRALRDSLQSFRFLNAGRILFYYGCYLKFLVPAWGWRVKQFLNSVESRWVRSLPSYDVAIAYGDTPEILAFVGQKIQAARKIAWLHNDYPDSIFNRRLWATYYKSYHAAYACSRDLTVKFSDFFQALGLRIEHIPYYLAPESYRQLSKEYVPFEKTESVLNLVSVGRICPQKGFDLAIEVADRLVKEGFRFKWYIVGGGADLTSLQKLASSRNLAQTLHFVGLRCNPYPFIACCDIYVQPSRHEGYCLTLAEARLLLRPIVTTNFVGASEQITDGETGVIVECSADAIADGVRKLLCDDGYRKRLSQNLGTRQHAVSISAFRQKVLDQ